MIYLSRPLLRKALEALGASLDDDGDVLTMNAPTGYLWQAVNGTTCCAPYTNAAGDRFLADALAALVHDASYGLRRCTAEESVELEHALDEEWIAAPDAAEFIEWRPFWRDNA